MLEILVYHIHWVLLLYNEADVMDIKISPFIFDNYYFLLIKGLIKVYTMSEIKQISDIPHGMIVINGITISILLSLLSLFVQLHNVILSESVILS